MQKIRNETMSIPKLQKREQQCLTKMENESFRTNSIDYIRLLIDE